MQHNKFNKMMKTFLENGFYAENLFNERKIPGLFEDQLISVENITI
jgi:hypothetical protein